MSKTSIRVRTELTQRAGSVCRRIAEGARRSGGSAESPSACAAVRAPAETTLRLGNGCLLHPSSCLSSPIVFRPPKVCTSRGENHARHLQQIPSTPILHTPRNPYPVNPRNIGGPLLRTTRSFTGSQSHHVIPRGCLSSRGIGRAHKEEETKSL